jgi:hypothetical protein
MNHHSRIEHVCINTKAEVRAVPVARVTADAPESDYAYDKLFQTISVLSEKALPEGAELYTAPPTQAVSVPEWVAFSDAEPDRGRKLLVTNHLHATNSFGEMSHVWMVSMAHKDADGSFSAFDEADRRIRFLTHWKYAFAAAPSPESQQLTTLGTAVNQLAKESLL